MAAHLRLSLGLVRIYIACASLASLFQFQPQLVNLALIGVYLLSQVLVLLNAVFILLFKG